MKMVYVLTWLFFMFWRVPTMQAREPVASVYKSEYGMVAKSVRLGSETAFCLELNKDICGEQYIIATLRGPSRDGDAAPVFILCEGKAISKRDCVSQLRFILPNTKLAEWVIHVKFYTKEKTGSGTKTVTLLHLEKTIKETLKEVYAKSVTVTESGRKEKGKQRKPGDKDSSDAWRFSYPVAVAQPPSAG